MQSKRAIKCPRNAKKFTVVRIKGDTYSGRSMEAAMAAAMPDPGNRVEVFATCAKDAGEARMLWGPKQLIRSFIYNSGRRSRRKKRSR